MALSDEATLVAFDADAVVEAARDVAGDSLLSAVEYTDEKWHALYVADAILAMYESDDHMAAHFDKIHQHNHVDTQEQTLFEQELTDAGEVQYFLTQMSHAAMIRVTGTEVGSGLWVTIQDDTSAIGVAERMTDALEA